MRKKSYRALRAEVRRRRRFRLSVTDPIRRVRSRLVLSLYMLVVVAAILSLVLSALAREGVIFQRSDVRFWLFGYALKDVLLLVIAVAAVTVLIIAASRTATNPFRDLALGMREVAKGNFDVSVRLPYHSEELGELERNFNRMTAELRSNEYLRKDFISGVSHQLKTPLSILHGYADLLVQGDLTETERQEYTAYVAEESVRLTELIDNMLRLSRIDHRQISPKAETFSLSEQLRQAVLKLEPRWSARSIVPEPELEEIDYTGDAELLSQVWLNLLDNAVKFSPEGGTIGITLRRSDTAVTCSIRDEGPGMDAETLSRVFEQFYQADTGRQGEGTGLGLPLAKRIAELHGGSIRAESSPGKGACFTVTLPL